MNIDQWPNRHSPLANRNPSLLRRDRRLGKVQILLTMMMLKQLGPENIGKAPLLVHGTKVGEAGVTIIAVGMDGPELCLQHCV